MIEIICFNMKVCYLIVLGRGGSGSGFGRWTFQSPPREMPGSSRKGLKVIQTIKGEIPEWLSDEKTYLSLQDINRVFFLD